jgi:glycine/D-amino acid oxidase-like deaminating enzyme/nitrite reductase/ring-hydroxylating ferredoxin subunit
MAAKLETKSFWTASASMPEFPRLDRDDRAEVVIVGGGLTGLTAAYLLARAGRSVAVVERYRIAQNDTGHTTAHVTMVTDARLTELIRLHGRDHAQAVWDAGLAAIHCIEQNIRREGIACDYRCVPAYLHAADNATYDDLNLLREEAETAVSLGFDAEFVDEVPLARLPGVRFDNQARIHPLKYLAGLAGAITALGGRIFEYSEADEFNGGRHVNVNGHDLSFDQLLIATHTPIAGHLSMPRASLLQTKIAPYNTYAVAARVARGSTPDALLWDTADPYHYYRITPDGERDIVIFGGEDHKTGQAADTAACVARLEARLKDLIPDAEIVTHWSGQVVETHDLLPYIGGEDDTQFVATGYAGNGMTFGTMAAMMFADRMLGVRNPWRDLFAVDRRVLRSAWDYIKENADYPYYRIRDQFAGADTRSLRAIAPEEGRIVMQNGEKLAVYRGSAGALSVRSAVCTHMGCIVSWNTAERTWDCPCHGSRFTAEGEVLSGPAERPLEPPRQDAGDLAS